MRIGRHRYLVEWGHLLVATLVAATSVVYLLDARAASLSINNLLVVQPAALLAIALYALIALQCFSRVAVGADDHEEPGEPARRPRFGFGRKATLVAALGLFACTFETIPVDVSTFAFLVVALFSCGERRVAWLVCYPAGFTFLLIEGYQWLVPYPLSTWVL